MVKGTWLDYEAVMAYRYLVYRELLVVIFVRLCTYVVRPYSYVLYLQGGGPAPRCARRAQPR